MAKSLSMALVLSLVTLAACSPKVNDPADVQAIKDTGPAYDKFANAGDAASLASEFYAADGIRMDPNQPASAGTAAIRATLEKSLRRRPRTSATSLTMCAWPAGSRWRRARSTGRARPRPAAPPCP